MTKQSKVSFGLTLLGFTLLVGLIVGQLTVANGAYMLLRGNPVLFLSILGALIAVATWVVVGAMHEDRRIAAARYDSDESFGSYILPLGLAVVAIFGVIFGAAYVPYQKAVATNESNTVIDAEEGVAVMPDFKPRAPYVIAEKQTADNTTINGTPQIATYVPDMGNYGAPVVKKGFLKGYGQVVWQKIGETGQAKVQSCSFSDAAARRMGGMFSHNLERAIMRKDFGVMIDSSDSYAYCNEEGEPIVVVPLTKYKGFFKPVEVAAGVAVYHGVTGELKLRKTVKAGEIPGPIYPKSLAASAREATTATSGWASWIQSNVGYTEHGGENSSDYTLRLADDSGNAYVTPLVMRGRGKAIISVGYQDASAVTAGKRNTYKIAKLPEARQGDSAMEAKVKADYSNLEWATKMAIFEIVPTSATTWSATLGQSKSIMYRLELNADGSSCLFDPKGKKLRCTGQATPDGASTPSSPEGNIDLKGISDEELVKLQEQVQAEVRARLLNK